MEKLMLAFDTIVSEPRTSFEPLSCSIKHTSFLWFHSNSHVSFSVFCTVLENLGDHMEHIN